MIFDPAWEAIHADRHWGSWPDEDLVRFVGRNYFRFHARHHFDFLDLGCGAGGNARFLATEGFSVTGIDGSKSAIERCFNWSTSKSKRWMVAPQFLVGDITKLPPREFDCIIDICSIQHLSRDDRKIAVEAAADALKPKGRMFAKMLHFASHGDLGAPDEPKAATVTSAEIHRIYSAFDFALFNTQYQRAHPRLGGVKQTIKHYLIEAVKR